MASQSLPQISLQFHTQGTQRADRLLNIACMGRRWFVELAPLSRADYLRRRTGRVEVTPEVGRAMVASAKHEGAVTSVHRWGPWTTWRLGRGSI